MKEVVIVSAVRTPLGSFGGVFADVPAIDLGTIVIKAAIERAGIEAKDVEEIIMGCVLQSGLGQNPTRQAAIKAGVPDYVPSFTINKVCGSGLKSVILGAQAIMVGDADIVIAGGMENMSQSPYVLDKARFGMRMGDGAIVDSMIKDGLYCSMKNYHMGITAENVAEKYAVSREEQDRFAVASQNKTEVAQKAGKFDEEIVPVTYIKKGKEYTVSVDEFPKNGTTIEKMAGLKTAFKKDGTVTAGNASGINDGAVALVMMSKEKAISLGIKPLATFVAGASAGVDPAIMGIGPIDATKKVLAKAGWNLADLDLIEANEAFAAQCLAVAKELCLDPTKVNVNGGAIALGHPIGASGARILVTLLYEMQKRDAKKGLATLCIGGGQGIAAIVER